LEPSEILTKISDHVKKHNLLSNVCRRLEIDFKLRPCLGVEIEFYLDMDTDQFKKEKGKYQYEIDLPPTQNILSLVSDIEGVKKKLKRIYPKINFHPKPFASDYGSAMHFHVNLLRADHSNYFDYEENIDHAANSLCHYLIPSFFIFAPDESHYARYNGCMAPTHVAYGPNNRTVAIRVPDMLPKRLEHRISSPMTDSYIAIFTILKSIYLGLKNPAEIRYYSKIHGNAFDEQYNLDKLPQSVNEAIKLLDENFFYL